MCCATFRPRDRQQGPPPKEPSPRRDYAALGDRDQILGARCAMCSRPFSFARLLVVCWLLVQRKRATDSESDSDTQSKQRLCLSLSALTYSRSNLQPRRTAQTAKRAWTPAVPFSRSLHTQGERTVDRPAHTRKRKPRTQSEAEFCVIMDALDLSTASASAAESARP